MNKDNILSLFSNSRKPLLLDGAIGSLLQQKGYKSDKHLWTSYVNFKYPNVIKKIHEEYIKAGCDLITTNTFRTNPIAFKKTSFEIDQELIIEQSVNLAKQAIGNANVIIAGSNPPAEDSYQNYRSISKNELIQNHHQHIDLLYKYGCDFILNETQSHFDEIEIICKYCYVNNIPYVISLLITDDMKIFSGENLTEVLSMINLYNPLLISFNCIFPNTFYKLLNTNCLINNWGFYLNCGNGNYSDKNISCGISPKEYLEIVRNSIVFKPKLIGTCCGSNPHHTKIIRDFLDENFSA